MAKLAKSKKIGLSINKVDLRESLKTVDRKIRKIIETASSELNHEVIKIVAQLIEPNIPVDTGQLKDSQKIVKDKFSKNGWIIGWTTEYAKVRYFGVGQESEWKTVDVDGQTKRKKFLLGVSGIPFWDRPVTRNTSLMLRIYQNAATKVFKKYKGV